MRRERWVALGAMLMLLLPPGVEASGTRPKLDPEAKISGPAVFNAADMHAYSPEELLAFQGTYRDSHTPESDEITRQITTELERRSHLGANALAPLDESRDKVETTFRNLLRGRRSARGQRRGSREDTTATLLGPKSTTEEVSESDVFGQKPTAALSTETDSSHATQVAAESPSGNWFVDARRELEAAQNDPEHKGLARGMIYSTVTGKKVAISQVATEAGLGEANDEQLANASTGNIAGEMRSGGLGDP